MFEQQALKGDIMKKVFLISTSLQQSTQLHNKDNSYSMGLAYLHSAIEGEGYNIITKNYNNNDEFESLNQISEIFNDFKPDYLLIQLFTMTRVSSYRIINFVKKVYPSVKIIVGGVHATGQYEQLLYNFPIDIVAIGEGEVTVVELLEALGNGRNINEVKGIAYRCGDKIVKTTDRPMLHDLDSIPFPKHELFITPETTMACILSSRGCPMKCSFCCLHTISKRLYRTRSAKNIADEVELIVSKFKNIKLIQIVDDAFNLNIKRTKDICREIIKRNIKIKFICSCRFVPMDAELVSLMEEAGFVTVSFGLETGSQKMLDAIHKNLKKESVTDVFKLFKKSKMDISTFLIVGFPGESKQTMSETITFIKSLREIVNYKLQGVAPLWVYPNTDILESAKQNGLLDDSYWLTVKDVPYYTVDYSFAKLLFFSLKINYYYSPIKCYLSMIKNYYRLAITPIIYTLRHPHRFRYLRKLYNYDVKL